MWSLVLWFYLDFVFVIHLSLQLGDEVVEHFLVHVAKGVFLLGIGLYLGYPLAAGSDEVQRYSE